MKIRCAKMEQGERSVSRTINRVLKSIFWTSLMTQYSVLYVFLSFSSFLPCLDSPLKIPLRPRFALLEYPVIVIFVAIGLESLVV